MSSTVYYINLIQPNIVNSQRGEAVRNLLNTTGVTDIIEADHDSKTLTTHKGGNQVITNYVNALHKDYS